MLTSKVFLPSLLWEHIHACTPLESCFPCLLRTYVTLLWTPPHPGHCPCFQALLLMGFFPYVHLYDSSSPPYVLWSLISLLVIASANFPRSSWAGGGEEGSAEEWRFINQKIITQCTEALETANARKPSGPEPVCLANDNTALWWPT